MRRQIQVLLLALLLAACSGKEGFSTMMDNDFAGAASLMGLAGTMEYRFQNRFQ